METASKCLVLYNRKTKKKMLDSIFVNILKADSVFKEISFFVTKRKREKENKMKTKTKKKLSVKHF